jgi:hypothetical protein
MQEAPRVESEPRNFKVEFRYDPNFIPPWYSKGRLDLKAPKSQHRPEVYAQIIQDHWDTTISPVVSPKIEEVLKVKASFFQSFTCYILEYRIRVGKNLSIEGGSKPLAIWAKPMDSEWGYLPFHARVIHETVHIIGPSHSPTWDALEDETVRLLSDYPCLWSDRNLREESVVRHTTYRITKKAFGKEFADWFLSQESQILPPT